jgi:hypothetical protein
METGFSGCHARRQARVNQRKIRAFFSSIRMGLMASETKCFKNDPWKIIGTEV